MNANAKKWVAALRSDRFKQVKYKLCNGDGYCCLGVGAELAVEAGVAVRFADNGKIHYRGVDESDGSFTGLRPALRDWLGLTTSVGSFGLDNDLSNLNDKQNKTFAEIADIIESEPPGLFV